ncbi:MAG: Peptide chain release factor subunit 1 [Candidatus Methanofastidiosum methylothiophilum]|uniref:Protein pelota homolog n=1 Tax=Candidatus Methanofastidiosum methylothiophilum TaxID=1705564 RepID=A0A150IT35_9EURY|nr:MAG: Peptide chain release factor subunit 1 [Candidatus Methanofastidiosum methylthiophilus]KYC48025.1 MAG: Peptide chain release factor subunit 1 [Candidatus Methanofastidiosum methylthiophilus]KYC50715.1 MAG: Peptide chain release factor subunit 1 [Candidatus Methanofastidiosum methylthiophilus]
MKILHRELDKGILKIRVDNADDLWHLSHIIESGDLLFGKTYRKEMKKGDKIRSEKLERIPVKLEITVEKIEFSKDVMRLRVTGVITQGEESGSYHTFNIEEDSIITLTKKWKNHQLDRIERAVKDTLTPKILIVCIEEGDADFGIITQYGVDFPVSVSKSIAGKHEISSRDKDKREFFAETSSKILENIQKYNLKTVIVAGPGFYKDEFLNYVKEFKPEILNNIITENVSTGGRAGVYECIKRGILEKAQKDLRVSIETNAVERLFEAIIKNEGVYGLRAIEKALEYGAINELLILDQFLRKIEFEEITENSREQRATIHVISSEHDAGKKLEGIGGIGAILRFKIDGL